MEKLDYSVSKGALGRAIHSFDENDWNERWKYFQFNKY